MKITKIDEYLRDHPLFKGMVSEDITFISGCAKNVHFNEGDFLFRMGAAADHFYIVRAGMAAIQLEAPGYGPATLQTLNVGDVAGWSWLFPPYEWHFDACAATDIRATEFDAVCMRGKSEDNPLLGYELMKRFSAIMADRLEATRLQLLDLYRNPSEPRRKR